MIFLGSLRKKKSYLRRVYRCACLQAHIEECFLNDKITILDINYHLNDDFNGSFFNDCR